MRARSRRFRITVTLLITTFWLVGLALLIFLRPYRSGRYPIGGDYPLGWILFGVILAAVLFTKFTSITASRPDSTSRPDSADAADAAAEKDGATDPRRSVHAG